MTLGVAGGHDSRNMSSIRYLCFYYKKNNEMDKRSHPRYIKNCRLQGRYWLENKTTENQL